MNENPVLYSLDPDDLLISHKPLVPKFISNCGCADTDHPQHKGKACLEKIKGNCSPSKGYFMCPTCKHEKQLAYDRKKSADKKKAV